MTTTVGPTEQGFLGRLMAWARAHELVRASLLSGGRASAAGAVDQLSDYDVILYVSDPGRFRDFGTWLPDLGTVLLRTPLEARENRGLAEYWRGVFFDDMTKVDFTVSPAAILPVIQGDGRLPPVLDLGYRVLLDKDGLTDGLLAPTRTAYITVKPTEKEFVARIEEFWWSTTYVAKYLWRDEVFAARVVLDGEMREHGLLPMLEWLVGAEHAWSVRTGALGRQLKRYLDPEHWTEVEHTFGGANGGHWQALFRTIEVFRSCAKLVAERLGYAYPQALDERMIRYLLEIRSLTKKG